MRVRRAWIGVPAMGRSLVLLPLLFPLLCIVISLCMWSYSVYELERKMCKCACSLCKARRT